MAKRIIFTRPEDGGLSVVIPVSPLRSGETEVAYLARIAAKSVPAGVPWRVVESTDLPADRTDRDAWVDDGRAVQVSAARKAALEAVAAAKRKIEVNRRRVELGFDPLP